MARLLDSDCIVTRMYLFGPAAEMSQRPHQGGFEKEALQRSAPEREDCWREAHCRVVEVGKTMCVVPPWTEVCLIV